MSAGPADKVLDVFKDLIFDQLVKIAISEIVGLAPFLAFGPISFIIGQVVTFIAGVLYKQLKMAINFEVIMLNNERLHREFVLAEDNLKSVLAASGMDSEAFKEAREKHKADLAKFIRYAGT